MRSRPPSASFEACPFLAGSFAYLTCRIQQPPAGEPRVQNVGRRITPGVPDGSFAYAARAQRLSAGWMFLIKLRSISNHSFEYSTGKEVSRTSSRANMSSSSADDSVPLQELSLSVCPICENDPPRVSTQQVRPLRGWNDQECLKHSRLYGSLEDRRRRYRLMVSRELLFERTKD